MRCSCAAVRNRSASLSFSRPSTGSFAMDSNARTVSWADRPVESSIRAAAAATISKCSPAKRPAFAVSVSAATAPPRDTPCR
ncbi:hypothetical protein G6F59_016819 [Rhizopus arrhizus]|nr:hypothetical protein G6F59_016819 [Rhizopus arrhizus]